MTEFTQQERDIARAMYLLNWGSRKNASWSKCGDQTYWLTKARNFCAHMPKPYTIKTATPPSVETDRDLLNEMVTKIIINVWTDSGKKFAEMGAEIVTQMLDAGIIATPPSVETDLPYSAINSLLTQVQHMESSISNNDGIDECMQCLNKAADDTLKWFKPLLDSLPPQNLPPSVETDL